MYSIKVVFNDKQSSGSYVYPTPKAFEITRPDVVEVAKVIEKHLRTHFGWREIFTFVEEDLKEGKA